MIFDESAVCTPVFCREVTGETPVLLPAAPFTVVLASSGRAAASADSEPVLLAAGGLKVEIGNGGHVARINLVDAFQANACHRNQPPYSSIILDFVDILDGWFRL